MRNQLKQLRERGRLTQEELATLLQVDAASISRWESGERPLTPRMIDRIARVFKVSSWELFLDRKDLRRVPGRGSEGSGEIAAVDEP